MNNYFNSYQSCKVPEVNGMNGANAIQMQIANAVANNDKNTLIL